MSNNNSNNVPKGNDSDQPTNPDESSINGQVPTTISRGRRSTNSMGRRRSMSSIEGLRFNSADERHSSHDIVPGSPYDIFEPRNTLRNNHEPARNVTANVLQTRSSTEIHETETPPTEQQNTATQEEPRPLRMMPSVASYCCRFCQLGDEREVLISPCKCKGSLAYIHYSCLTRWLNQSGRNTCELCQFRFDTIETRRYTMCQSLRIWVRHPRNRPHINTILFISGLLTLFVLGLILMVMLGMNHFLLEGRKIGIAPYWVSGTVSFFLILVLIVYVLTLYLLFRDQLGPWYRWWHRCVTVRIVIDPATVKAAPRPNFYSTGHSKCLSARSNSSSSSDSLETTTNSPVANNMR